MFSRPVLIVAMLGLSTAMVGCKKKPPVTPAPVEAPTEEDSTDASAGGDPDSTETDAPSPEEPTPDEPSVEPTTSDADPEDVRKAVNAVLDKVDSTDVAENRAALDALRALQNRHPDLAEIDLNIGVVEHKLGNSSGARAAYESALSKDPTVGHAYLYLGAIQEEAGDLTGAESKYRQGLDRAPDDVAVRIGLVSTLRKQGRYDEAIQEAQEALKVNATSPEIYNDVGLAYVAQDDFLLAKFMFRKGLALPEGEEKAYLHANLGWAYYLEGKIPEASFRLQKAVELDPNYVPGLVYLARVYMEDRNYVDTVDLLERAAAKSPENHGVQMNLGIAYRGVERFEDAKAAYQRALQLEPSNPAPHFNLGILEGDYLKNYDASVAAFEQYKSMGGEEAARADEYIAAVQREARRVEKRRKREAEAKKREADRAEQKRLAEEERKREEEQKRLEAEEAARNAQEDATETEDTVAPSPEEGSPSPDEDAADGQSPDEAATPDATPEEVNTDGEEASEEAPDGEPAAGEENPWSEQ